MDEITRKDFEHLWSEDKEARYQAFLELLETTGEGVDWAYQVWDELLQNLNDKDNHVRAIAAQLLCNLSRSDPRKRMLEDFPALLEVTRDVRFVTARHTLQAIWKVGTAGEAQRKILLEGLTTRFHECAAEKNTTLIRYDIIVGLRYLYDQTRDEAVRELALDLIELEGDDKYQKKYAGVWKGTIRQSSLSRTSEGETPY